MGAAFNTFLFSATITGLELLELLTKLLRLLETSLDLFTTRLFGSEWSWVDWWFTCCEPRFFSDICYTFFVSPFLLPTMAGGGEYIILSELITDFFSDFS